MLRSPFPTSLAIALAATASVATGVLPTACTSNSNQPPIEGTGTPGSSGGTSKSGGGDAGGATPSTCGFATTPTAFALPLLPDTIAAPFTTLPAASVACASGSAKLAYSMVDLDADGRLDLLVTSDCNDATIGASAWLVYFGSSSGFASTATRFTLPASTGSSPPLLIDVTGDLRPDYVVTSATGDATVGVSRWLVYAGSGTSFAATPVAYALPPGAPAGAPAGTFAATSSAAATCTNGTGTPAFALFDLNGDEFLDFVETQVCDDDSVGTLSWRVYLGSAAGASQTSVAYALPSSPVYTSGAFAALHGTLSCTGGASVPQFGVLDVDDDGKPDIVVTQSCNDGAVGSTVWLWFHNTGTAFGPSAMLSLPQVQGVPTNAFPALSAAGTCANGVGAPTYAVADANGDGLPDMVVTRDCADNQTGSAYWQLYANTGTGFRPTFEALTLPAALGATTVSPVGFQEGPQCQSAPVRPTFVTTYLAGNTLSIVATTSCTDTTVGGTQWEVYPASCK